jgi:phosphoribosyl-ATP pyrophosphohydrolase/phosphoribosyl-AMP cyclohydrolase
VTLPQVRFGPDGLAPAVVQDAADGRVLMLAWMDAEALAATIETGDVHFHSRSRGRLWRKGETSGNILRLRGLSTDCDDDAILVTAEPAGPTCHRGRRSCFDDDSGVIADGSAVVAASAESTLVADDSGVIHGAGLDAAGLDSAASAAADLAADFAWLETLWATIVSRAAERPAGSYTTRLLDGGVDAVSRKVTEEATEVLIAAKDDAVAQSVGAPRNTTRAALSGEVADLLYHALVLLAERDLTPREVIAVLRARHGDRD